MPLYEYQCDACGHRFEKIQKFSDPPVEKCPVCGGAVHKLQSAPAFQFKGSGWYVTDYAKKNQGGGAAAKASSEKKDEAKPAADSSSDKPASSTTTPASSTTSTKE